MILVTSYENNIFKILWRRLMANAEVCSGIARLNNELRSSPKDKIEKSVSRKLTYGICLSSNKNMQNSE